MDVYCSDNVLFREFFWLRLRFVSLLMAQLQPRGNRCLDFCGGSGIFLASLAPYFDQVDLLDRNTDEARELVGHLGLQNINIIQANAGTYDYQGTQFDAIVAADVLEHFLSLDEPISNIKKWLHPDGILFTSLPTENLFYRLLRIPFKKTKPHDHYHMSVDVEKRLKEHGFRKVAGICHPLLFPVLPLFRISAWKKSGL